MPRTPAERYLDLDAWPRRAAFEFFRRYDQPCFEITARVEVGPLVRWCRAEGVSFSTASLYLLTQVVNEYEPFRYRLEGDRVRVHDVIHPSSTERVGEEGLVFLYVDWDPDFGTFVENLETARREAREQAEEPSDPADVDAAIGDVPERTDVFYFSSLPWISFTSITHARHSAQDHSVPKITFGRYEAIEGGTRMPVSVEAHHALMDGFHAGVFFERLERSFGELGGVDARTPG